MADEADVSDVHVEAHLEIALHKTRNQPQPVLDGDGNKICLDCEEVIPKERAKISVVIRCMDCQIIHEKEERC